ncbi:MAG: FmdB family zinc ribbon protein [Pseudomonadota bacterium]|jgi:putative FmdB family regulatory protein
MPIYEYECPDCGRFETIQKISDKPLSHCPRCKEAGRKSPVKKAVSASAFHLKGTGWYKTDYSSNTSSGSGKKANGSSSGDSSAGSSGDSKAATAPAGKACGTGCGCH